MENLNIISSNKEEYEIYMYGVFVGNACICKDKYIVNDYSNHYVNFINYDQIENEILYQEKLISFGKLPLKINLDNQKKKNIFLRGYFDGTLPSGYDYNFCEKLIFEIKKKYHDYIPTSYVISKEDENIIIIEGCNIIEFIDALYRDANFYGIKNFLRYKNDLIKMNIGSCDNISMYYKTIDDAIIPTKNRITDSGYDMHIIKKISQKKNLYMYDTGIIVQPPFGIYFDLVPRSSIIKKGYILANSIGIIDQTFRGSIKVALLKVNEDAEELELPLKLVQLIPRQVIHLELREIKNKEDILSTVRGCGEYGSTDTPKII